EIAGRCAIGERELCKRGGVAERRDVLELRRVVDLEMNSFATDTSPWSHIKILNFSGGRSGSMISARISAGIRHVSASGISPANPSRINASWGIDAKGLLLGSWREKGVSFMAAASARRDPLNCPRLAPWAAA